MNSVSTASTGVRFPASSGSWNNLTICGMACEMVYLATDADRRLREDQRGERGCLRVVLMKAQRILAAGLA